MANSNQGGNSKNDSSQRGGSHEQHVKVGQQSHKNDADQQKAQDKKGGGQQGGSHEQHVKAGQQSHKNDKS